MKQLYKLTPYIIFGLIFTVNLIFAQDNIIAPSVDFNTTLLSNTQKQPRLNRVIEEGEQESCINNVKDRQRKDVTLIYLTPISFSNLRSHRNQWFKSRLHFEVQSSDLSLVLNHDKYYWPHEYTFNNLGPYQILEREISIG